MIHSDHCPTCGCTMTTGGCANAFCQSKYIATHPLSRPVPSMIPAPQVGWLCPKCGRGNAPWLSQCSCAPTVQKETENG